MANLQHFTAAIVAGLMSAGVAYGVASAYKPKPVIVQPQTVTVAKGAGVTRAEQRQAASQWGDLAQKEIDSLTVALHSLPAAQLVIFCQDDAKCGDMALDFENAFESAHWKEVKQETPLIDDTVGVATSREDIRKAIDEATSGRLSVKIIKKNAPYEVLVIGKKPKA